MDRHIKLVLILGIVVVSLSAFYYLVVFIPHQAREAQSLKEAQVAQENQQKCQQDGSKFFSDYKAKTAQYNIEQPLITPFSEVPPNSNPYHFYTHMLYKFDDPVYYFNKQLGTCLVLINYETSTHASVSPNPGNLTSVFDSGQSEIIDIYSNKVLAPDGSSKDFQQQEKELLGINP